MSVETTSAKFFEEKYQHDTDPWDFAGSRYENARYDAIVSALGERRFQRAYEPGCSVGVLTRRLAAICDRVDASDFSATAAAAAAARCADLANVSVRCAALTDGRAAAGSDLVVLSEIGYYFTAAALHDLTGTIVDGMPPGGVMLGCHWLGHSADHILHGAQVHEVLRAHHTLIPIFSERHLHAGSGYLLECWSRR